MHRRRLLALPAALAVSRAARTTTRPVGVAGDPAFATPLFPPGHPERPARVRAVERALAGEPGIARLSPSSDAVAESVLGLVHPPAHVAAVRRGWPRAHALALRATAVVLGALEAVVRGGVAAAFCAVRPPGHHAYDAGAEEGFCFYNHVAVAARYAQRRLGIRRVLVVDWDYHHGNGTEAVFYEDPTVLVFSTHDRDAYPGTGDPARTGAGPGRGFNINVHLPCGSTDADILRAFERHLLPAARVHAPELVLVSAGFDSRMGDPLGCFEVTDAGFAALTRAVAAIAAEYAGGRLLTVLEGGYDPAGTASAARAHVRALAQPGAGSGVRS